MFQNFIHRMNERERVATAAYEDAQIALAKTRDKLEEAERVVSDWRRLMSDEDWDHATTTYKNKTFEEWKKEVEKLEKQKEKDEHLEKEARASFDRVVQGNSFSNSSTRK